MADIDLVIKIPEDHGIDVDDKFQDFFTRLRFEITRHLTFNTSLVCGAYELETVDMLMEAFAKSTPLLSRGRWIDGHCSECGCDMPAYIIDWKWQKDMNAKYCPMCGTKMEVKESEEIDD